MFDELGEASYSRMKTAESVMKESFDFLRGCKIVGDSHSHHVVSLRRVLTGYLGIDNITGGILPGEVLLVTGEPGVGKTAFVTNIVMNVAKAQATKGARVLVFDLESSSAVMGLRMLSSESGVSFEKMRWDKLDEGDWDVVVDAADVISRCDVYVCDDLLLTPERMCTIAYDMVEQAMISLIVLDGATGSNWLAELKMLARTLGVPAIATAVALHPRRDRLADYTLLLKAMQDKPRVVMSKQIIALLSFKHTGLQIGFPLKFTPGCLRFDEYPEQPYRMYRRYDSDVRELAHALGWSWDDTADALNDAYEQRVRRLLKR